MHAKVVIVNVIKQVKTGLKELHQHLLISKKIKCAFVISIIELGQGLSKLRLDVIANTRLGVSVTFALTANHKGNINKKLL